MNVKDQFKRVCEAMDEGGYLPDANEDLQAVAKALGSTDDEIKELGIDEIPESEDAEEETEESDDED